MATVRAGISSVALDGVHMDVTEISYSPNTIKRETMAGMDSVHGVKETPTAGSISLTIRDAAGLSIADFESMTATNVAIHLGNGKSIVGTGMWTVDTQEVEAGEATIKVKFEGVSVSEIGA